jgi:hypothetical protein
MASTVRVDSPSAVPISLIERRSLRRERLPYSALAWQPPVAAAA